jgi:DNA-binding MarR family transcriptional regulator
MTKQQPSMLHLVTDIQRATHVLGLRLEADLADLNLSQGEIHVLSLLARAQPMSVSDLQQGVRHRPSTLTGILDRLAGKALVRRLINEADRRSFLIELTGEGRLAAARVARAMSTVERRLAKGRRDDDLDAVRSVLSQIASDV